MAVRLVQVNVKARDDSALGRFWAEALDWNASSGGNGATSVAPAGFVWTDPDAPVCIDVIAVPDAEAVKYRMHIDLATTSAPHQAEWVARLEQLGATPADVGQGDVPWTVLADPEGNVFCVLEPRDIYRTPGRSPRWWSTARTPGPWPGSASSLRPDARFPAASAVPPASGERPHVQRRPFVPPGMTFDRTVSGVAIAGQKSGLPNVLRDAEPVADNQFIERRPQETPVTTRRTQTATPPSGESRLHS